METSPPRLVRAIGLLSLTVIALNGMIGAGIYVLPADVARLLGAASPVAYLVSGAAIALVALCFSEAASLFERSGGPYMYAREAFGSFVAFETGWAFLLTRLTSTAALVNAFASYLTCDTAGSH